VPDSTPFPHEYDPAALIEVRPRGQAFTLLTPPRYREHYEARAYEGFSAALLAAVLGRCGLFVDVGAHAGFFSVLAAHHHPALEVLAFEPTPESFAVLQANLARNSCARVTACQAAVSDADGQAQFQISAASDNCSFYPHPHAPPVRQVAVATRALDRVLAGREPTPALVKLDTDGHELAVLRGMAETLARWEDLSLLVEFNPKMQRIAGHAPEELLRELDRLGFALFLLDDEAHLARRLPPDETWRQYVQPEAYANLYCVRRERALSVCCFAHSAGLGGAERSLLELVRELIADHGAVCTVVLPGEGPLGEQLRAVGAATVRADCPWWCDLNTRTPAATALAQMQPGADAFLRELLPTLAGIAPDVCLTQTLVIPWGAVGAALLGRPHVWSVCEYGEQDHGLRFYTTFPGVVQDIAAASHLVYTPSEDVRRVVFGETASPPVRTLYRHVPMPQITDAASGDQYFQRPGAFRLGVFGTVSASKGQEDAVRALVRLRAAGREVELLLAGGLYYPDYQQRLEELIAGAGLAESVHLSGVLPDPYPAMQACDAVVVCSRSEAFGRVPIEAMLLGKPVIYAAAAGPAEYMRPGQTGLPYPPGDDAALAAAVARLMDEPALGATLGAEGRRYATERFSRAAYGGEVFRALLALAQERPPVRPMPAALQPLIGAAVRTVVTETQAARAQALDLQAALAQAGKELEQVRAQAAAQAEELAIEREVCTAQVRALEEKRVQLEAADAALTASRTDLAATRDTLAATQGALSASTANLAATQQTLTATQQSLLATQVELGCAQATLASTRAQLAVAEQEQKATELRLGQTQARLEQAAAVVVLEQSLSWKLTKPLRSLAKRTTEARELARRGWVRLHLTSGSRRLHRAAKLLRRSGLFDAGWYVQQYPAARHGRPDPVLHYLVCGAREGCDPNPLFDGEFYLRQNPDVAAVGMNPLVHYLHHGVAEGRDPQALFDTDWYLAQHPDVAAAGLNPLAHYLAHGAGEGRQPGPGFDANAYLEANPDLRDAGVNPLAHYRWHGRAEGRRLRPAPQPVVGPLPDYPIAAVAPARARRVVFLSGEPHTPGHDYRVRMYAKALTARGCAVEIVPLDQAGQGLPLPLDLLVIWRAAWTGPVPGCVAAARSHGAKVVFDVDDLMIDPELARIELVDGIRSQGFTEPAIAEMYRQMQQTMLAADFCTCTTQPLASAMRRFQKTTFVLPNGFDDVRYQRSRQAVAARRQQPGDGLIRIGYAGGSRTHQKDFACAVPGLARILREHPECRLVLFRLELASGKFACLDAHEYPELAGLEAQIEWRPMVPVQELPGEMARFDINLAPLEVGNAFCEAKSELKYFEAALVEVVTVASPTQPYAAAMQHGQTGLLAGDDAAWYAALKQLVTEPELRRRLGAAAYLDVLWQFGPERRGELASAVIEQMLDSESETAARHFERELRRAASPRRAPPDCAGTKVVFNGGAGGWSEVAVVMPLHNYASHVVEALESVKRQTLPAKALVVVEDGSTDDSLRVAEHWLRKNAAHFTQAVLLQNHQNCGLARTRNAGFAFADAPYVLALDADNVLLPQCLDRSLAVIEQTGAAAVFATIQEFGDDHGQRSNAPWQAARFVGGNYVDAMAMIRRSAWAAVGGYQRMSIMGWEDYELWCRFVEEGFRGVWLPEILSRYRVHRRSMLQTHTDLGEHRRRLSREMKHLHPWVDALAAPSCDADGDNSD
jgi:FkbM family methyltransferase